MWHTKVGQFVIVQQDDLFLSDKIGRFHRSFVIVFRLHHTEPTNPSSCTNEEHSLFAADTKVWDVAIERSWSSGRRCRRCWWWWCAWWVIQALTTDSKHINRQWSSLIAVWFSLTKTKMVKNEKITNSLTKTKTKTKKWWERKWN